MQAFQSVHPFQRAPHKTLVRLALPVLVSLAAEPVTDAIDTAFVARLGAPSLAALGVGATLLSGFFWIITGGWVTLRALYGIVRSGPASAAVP
ncbi:MAG: MATE family efflux transporter [Desulfobacterales bacterium]|nr:MATE family efflux transporter [Desulfobacterales bacterium]MDJ0854747.1 MATE family efflux transporter [Desulfobacterales bacterium]MDJ0886708.1 MATE family efflux transporter [Desulfobacterales bacterium]MDJ0988990.1 MATE family efflux transporter [Desulfobacterales bacterium]